MEIIFYNSQDAITFLQNSVEFITYLKNTNSKTLPEKTGSTELNINTYLNRVKDFTTNEIIHIKKIINNLPNSALISDTWNLIKVSNNLEKSWPFTIENTIVVTSLFLKQSNMIIFELGKIFLIKLM